MFDLYEKSPAGAAPQSVENREGNPFPYVVWRAYAAMYITCRLDLFSGPPEGCLQLGDCWFQHPAIAAGSRVVTPELRLVIEAFAGGHRLDERRFDLCIVWGPQDGTYVNREGKVTRSTSLPKSRVGL